MKSDRKRLTSEPSETKLHISESCVQSSLGAVELDRARCCIVESGLENQLRDAVIYLGTSELRNVTIA